MASPPLVEVRPGRVAELVLANPPLNLITLELTCQLRAAIERVARDDECRALVVHGGSVAHFSAGSDISEFEALAGRVAAGKLRFENLTYSSLAALSVPVIAAIEGVALGGGLELALCCDLRVAGADARFGFPEGHVGVIPGSGGTQRLPRLVGPARAAELIFFGEPVDAQTALMWGLVNRVTEPRTALEAARRIGEVIAAMAPLAMAEAKRLMHATSAMPIELGVAVSLEASERVFASADMLEGVHAFFEKRRPEWHG